MGNYDAPPGNKRSPWAEGIFLFWPRLLGEAMEEAMAMGVLFGCFGGKKVGFPGLLGGLMIYQDHLFALEGHLWPWHL